ncbi:hypothetical protein B0H11DRAFT_1945528 [Mycena galericulata]|nr:hypothetical protein B0H11DRAFT_1945528 [Mycena galericulata]
MPPGYETLRSGSWWKDFHENRRRARAIAESNSAPKPLYEGIDLHPQLPAITFVVGRSDEPPIPTTATHGLPPSKALEKFKKRFPPARDPDEELLARLAESRVKHKKRDERRAAATDAQRKKASARKASATKR